MLTDDASRRGFADGTCLCADHRNSTFDFIMRQTDRHLRGMIRVKTPAVASSDWDTSAARPIRWCRFLLVEAAQAAARNPDWRRRYIHLAAVGTRASPGGFRTPSREFACTGCGGTVVSIRRRWSSVRTQDSSVPDMV